MNKLNGWQRLFALIAILWLAAPILSYDPPRAFIDPDKFELAIKEFLPQQEVPAEIRFWIPRVAYVSQYGGIPVADDDLPENLRKHPERGGVKEYRMDTGALVTVWSGYTLEQVQQAYSKAADKFTYAHRVGVVKALSFSVLVYVLPLAFLYFLGWMLGWIYRGFRNK